MKCPKCGSQNTKIIIGELYRCGDCGHKFKAIECGLINCGQHPKSEENDDQSVYSDDSIDTQEDDMEDDLALLDDDDDLW
jgi:transposase